MGGFYLNSWLTENPRSRFETEEYRTFLVVTSTVSDDYFWRLYNFLIPLDKYDTRT